jgi:hypothetical protein
MTGSSGLSDRTRQNSDATTCSIVIQMAKKALVTLGLGYECVASGSVHLSLPRPANNRRMGTLMPFSALFL